MTNQFRSWILKLPKKDEILVNDEKKTQQPKFKATTFKSKLFGGFTTFSSFF